MTLGMRFFAIDATHNVAPLVTLAFSKQEISMSQRSRTSRITGVAVDNPPIVNLWMLRLLVPLNAQQEFVQSHGFRDDSIAAMLGCVFQPIADGISG